MSLSIDGYGMHLTEFLFLDSQHNPYRSIFTDFDLCTQVVINRRSTEKALNIQEVTYMVLSLLPQEPRSCVINI